MGIDTRRCFLLCRLVSRSSLRLFMVLSLSAKRIISFSLKHKSQALPPLANGYAFTFLDHFISNGIFLSFNFHTWLDSAVWFVALFVSECLCTAYLFLKSVVEP